MRTSVALSATVVGLLSAALASAQTPAVSATPAAPAPAATDSPADASTPAEPAPAEPSRPLADPKLVVVPADKDQPDLEPIPSAKDRLGGHFVIGASAGVKWALGTLDDGVSSRSQLGPGLGLNLDLGYGISRNIVLGVWGEYDKHSSYGACSGCSGTSVAGGPFLRYHLVQGTRFDPWGMIGAGVRSTKLDVLSRNGFEIVKLTMGGDWYPTSNFGFGPYVTFDMGLFDSSVHTGIGTGLRFVLDLPGK